MIKRKLRCNYGWGENYIKYLDGCVILRWNLKMNMLRLSLIGIVLENML